MKVHLGCGTTYLKGYINIDASPNYLTPDAPPSVLTQNITLFEQYYKHEFCKGSGLCVADMKADISNLKDIANGEVLEAVMIHVLEHIPSYDTNKVLKEVNRILVDNGTFIIGVPDIKETSKMLAEANLPEEEDWCIRLIHGTQRNKWSHHYCGYTERILKETLKLYGFGKFETLSNINFYPAIHIKAFKEKKCGS